MRPQSLILYFLIFCFIGCKKVDPTPKNPYGAGKGNITIFIKSDLQVGNITVTIGGQQAGVISHFNSTGPDCGHEDVNFVAAAGTYTFTASGTSGGNWSGNVTIAEGVCNSLELTNSGGGGGIAGSPGNPRFNLQFTNSPNVDLDLYVTTPNNITISYSNQSGDNGRLDVDCKCSSCQQGPNENIYWVNGTAPHGTYKFWVKYYGACNSPAQPSNFTLRLLNQSTIIQTITGTLSAVGQTSSMYTFTY